MSRRVGHFIFVLLWVTALSLSAEESTANGKDEIVPVAPPNGPLEQTPLKFNQPATTQSAVAPISSSAGWDYARIPVALAGIIVLILVMRWVGKGISGRALSKNGGRGVEVLSRSAISPRQQLLVVRFGRKLLLVGSNGGDMTSLCQLDQPDEVAEVLAQLSADKPGFTRNFRTAFSGAEKPYAETEAVEAEESQPSTEESNEELSGLMKRIRRMTEKFQQS